MAITNLTEGDLNIGVVEHAGLTWYDLRSPGTAEMEFLGEHFPFHPLDLDDCRSRVQIPKLDVYPEYIFLVLHFPLFDARMRLTRPSQVALFAGESYVVTVHGGDLRPLTKLFADAEQSDAVRQQVMGSGPGFLLYSVLDGLVDYSFPIVDRLITLVDGVEAQILEHRPKGLAQDMAYLRRDILSFRRVVRPQIDVIETLEGREFRFLRLDSNVYFGDLADHMRRIWVELEELKEVVEGLEDTYLSTTSQHTNQVMRVLTVFASVMLPLTVVTGLYGMNVDLPWADSSWAFGMVLGIMAGITTALLAFFWKRGWL